MACPKCGQPHMFDVVPEMRADYPDVSTTELCPSCAEDARAVTDYEYNEHDDTVTCGKCKTVTDMTDPRTLVNDGKDDDIWLWKCPTCGRVYDLGV